MTTGRPSLLPRYPHRQPDPISVRQVRSYSIGFLQIPPRDGHPCLALCFRSSRYTEDFHLHKTKHAWQTNRGAVGDHPTTRVTIRSGGFRPPRPRTKTRVYKREGLEGEESEGEESQRSRTRQSSDHSASRPSSLAGWPPTLLSLPS